MGDELKLLLQQHERQVLQQRLLCLHRVWLWSLGLLLLLFHGLLDDDSAGMKETHGDTTQEPQTAAAATLLGIFENTAYSSNTSNYWKSIHI